MKHVGKRLLAVLLAVVMVLGSISVVSAESSDSGITGATLIGAGWWTYTAGMTFDDSNTMSGDGTVEFDVYCAADSSGYAAFTIQMFDADGTYLTATSDGDSASYLVNESTGSVITAGDTYTVTITRGNSAISLEMYDKTNEEKFATWTFSDLNGTMTIRFLVHYGVFEFANVGEATELPSDATVLTSTTWWSWVCDDTHSYDDDGTYIFDVYCVADISDYAAFTIQLFDADGTYLGASSDGDSASYLVNESTGSVITAGQTYTVIVQRLDGVITLTMYDKTNGKTFARWSFNDLNGTMTIRLMAQIGCFAFTEVSYTDFLGGSLRIKDSAADYSKTNLRFGYTITLPEGAELTSWYWNWGTDASNLSKHVTGVSKVEDEATGVITTNLVITGIPSASYGTTIYSQLVVVYELDGVTYTVTDSVQSRTVDFVADSILKDAKATEDEKAYAEGILEV